jgi:hypothetical protein
MSLVATDKYLAKLVFNLSEALMMFSNEAVKLSGLLELSEAHVSTVGNYALQRQSIAEVQAFEEYLNRKEEILAYLKVESR